jgi:hypothetical protein
MTKRAFMLFSIALLAAASAGTASAERWERGYVVGFYKPAFHYGGRADFVRPGQIEPGVDCPQGSTTHFANPAMAEKSLALVPWRSAEEVHALANPPLTDEERLGAGLYYPIWRAASAYRGYTPDIETYINPFAAEDPGQPQVVSRIGEGFNLDGKIKETDFVSPAGEKGIDNVLYRAWGCDAPWRGIGEGLLVLRSNDKMTEGLFTVVIRISGNQDPMNDQDATLEIGYSPDKIMKNALGKVGADYSYRILSNSEQYTKLKATVRDGVVETEQADIHMPQIAWWYNQNRDAFFRDGKVRVTVKPDGSADGLVGGYRDWRDIYAQNVFSQDGGQQGVREHEDHVALYYALRRHADGMLNPKTGRYDGVSSAYRMDLVPAFVVDPDKPMEITINNGERRRWEAFENTTAAMIKATETLIPQAVPANSGENAVGRGGVPIERRRDDGDGEPAPSKARK